MRPETLALIGVVGAAAITTLGALLAKRARAPQDASAIRKAEQEIVKVALENTKELIAQQENIQARERAQGESQMMALQQRLDQLDQRLVRIHASMLAHQPWDRDAVVKLRETDPGWPGPPPLDV